MNKLAIQAEGISKQYRLGEVGTGTLSHDLNRFWAKFRGKEDPYLKVGDTNDRSIKGNSEYVWSLKDINFEIHQGDAVGIIGRNGAGKSTLLKLLSKVTKPTTGSFKINGRIASLLEVGTGFNPEMTGRENIFMNGAILGMRRSEIKRKLDEIIAFSGVERYVDTPVKRYSSGMYVRLAFAVAAHLESEILIVDEVLAVGDAEFQRKCLGKMGEVSKEGGRTVLFVSHNMGAVENLCKNGIFLSNGQIVSQGQIKNVISDYNSFVTELIQVPIRDRVDRSGNKQGKFIDFKITNSNRLETNQISCGERIYFSVCLELKREHIINDLNAHITFYSSSGNFLFTCATDSVGFRVDSASNLLKLECQVEKFPLTPGKYYYNLFLKIDGEISDWIQNAGNFSVVDSNYFGFGKLNSHSGGVIVDHLWSQKI